jgi:hypothetical protein
MVSIEQLNHFEHLFPVRRLNVKSAFGWEFYLHFLYDKQIRLRPAGGRSYLLIGGADFFELFRILFRGKFRGGCREFYRGLVA